MEPQLSQHLQGDYKTGKRLNMKKIISFIASHYRNDKIWLRRTLPSKRDYKILVAIDDSLSMQEQQLGFFSLEACVAITEALARLEVGKVAIAAIRERLEIFQGFEDGGGISCLLLELIEQIKGLLVENRVVGPFVEKQLHVLPL